MWRDRTRARQRTVFCDKYEGFGGLCNCSDPDPLDVPFRPVRSNVMSQKHLRHIGSHVYATLIIIYVYELIFEVTLQ